MRKNVPVFVRTLAMTVLVTMVAATAGSAGTPGRIVSLNVCVDQILVDLVARERIAALSYLATDPLTAVHPERATGSKTIKGSAEEVVALAPDLVIAGQYSTPATVDILRRLGLRIEVVPMPATVADVARLIRTLAGLVGEPARGEALVIEMEGRISAAVSTLRPDAAALRPSAIVYQVNDFVSTGGDLAADALALAGFRNIAIDLVHGRGRKVSVEALVAAPPDLLVLAGAPTTYRTAVADNLRHPALARIAASRPRIVIDWPLLLCGTHHIAEAVERLVRARSDLAAVRR